MNAATEKKTAPIELRVTDLRKSFVSQTSNRIEVLRGINLEVSAGEAVAITGASGSGKSTLLHLLGGVVESDHGSILLGNTEVEKLSGNAASHFRQFQVGFVFQFHYLMTDLSTIENVALPLLIKRLKRSQAFAEAKALLTELGLGETLNIPISQLSGGEQQRVAIARAIAKRPELLLCDEPTGALDFQTGVLVLEVIERVNRELGTTTIVITHNVAIARMADRVIRLGDGRVTSIERNPVKAPPRELEW